MPSPSSEDRPVIRSRTGKFLQGMFGKDSAEPELASAEPSAAADTPSEFMRMVPEPSTWDDTEESNWDDDFVEAPAPFPVSNPSAAEPAEPEPPAPPPDDSNQLMRETLRELAAPPATLPQDQEPRVPLPPAPPSVNQPSSALASEKKGPVEVNIPRPRNIKYKNKATSDSAQTASSPQRESIDNRRDTPLERAEKSASKAASGDDQAIELNIKRPTTIKYKTKSPEPVGPLARLQASLAKVFRRPVPSPPQEPTSIDAAPSKSKGGWKLPTFKLPQLPSLAMADRKQVLTIAAVVFLALTAAWATINFWPQPVVEAQATLTQPALNPETELVQAVQSKLQVVAGKYPAGLISNLELAEDSQLATVVVSNQWFNLPLAQRQQTAQSLWQQAVDYRMARLEVRAIDDRLLARSPVVGGEAIVLDNF
jgi:hypothetical protein